MREFNELYTAILEGDAPAANRLAKELISLSVNPQKIVDDCMIPAMNEVGRRFECGDYFVPELMMAARAMKAALEVIQPLLAKQGSKTIGTVAIGTVKGDLHDIGKNLVAAMLEGSGFKVIDLGVDVPPESFVNIIKGTNVNIIALSTLLTTTMPWMKNTIDTLKREGLRDKVKVMIGGAPVTKRFAEEIGADGYSENAAGAVELARSLVGS
jgi:corrinoid protein of di/trimethylamine methyltransferase